MATQATLRCRCGTMRGSVLDVSPSGGNHFICYCDDCQAFARFLGREDALDAHGGTEVFHATPAQVRIAQGMEQLRCIRLSDKGMLRWYAACCRTPIANSLPPRRLPFVSLLHTFIDEPPAGRLRDAAFGPITAHVHARFARNGKPAGVDGRAPIGLILRSIRLLALGLLRGQHTPSAFLDETTGKPRVEVQVLTTTERDGLRPAANGA